MRGYLVHVRDEALRLRERGATVDENALTRRPSWERPEWIGLTARAFYDTGAPV